MKAEMIEKIVEALEKAEPHGTSPQGIFMISWDKLRTALSELQLEDESEIEIGDFVKRIGRNTPTIINGKVYQIVGKTHHKMFKGFYIINETNHRVMITINKEWKLQ